MDDAQNTETIVPGGRLVRRRCLVVQWTYQGVELYTEAPLDNCEVLLNLIDTLSGAIQSQRVEEVIKIQPDEPAATAETD